MKRKSRSLFGRWVPGRAYVTTGTGDELIPMRFDTECHGLGLHGSVGGYGWNITHLGTGTSVMTRIRSKQAAQKAMLALCRGLQESCGFTWGDITSTLDREKLGCAHKVLVPIRDRTPIAEAPGRKRPKPRSSLYKKAAPRYR